ncbi:transposase [Bradyrhizobium sp. UFLA06-06]|nr:hypothetical protein [Bradyrhizobium brasilense]NWL40704.1 hypothetical protein [Bradyrhizobium elkanii]NWL69869.1 hypothetical protein [Bradyrhizobium elkanii]RYM23978.1 hypothetical protein EWH13_17820 [Bradyrhizobium elkanii]
MIALLKMQGAARAATDRHARTQAMSMACGSTGEPLLSRLPNRAFKVNSFLRFSPTLRTSAMTGLPASTTDRRHYTALAIPFTGRGPCVPSRSALGPSHALHQVGKQGYPSSPTLSSPSGGRTKPGRLWMYAHDQRSLAGPEPPAAVYVFASDRKAERPATHLAHFKGLLHIDGYAGFGRLTDAGNVILAACWAHTGHKFYEVAQSEDMPVSHEALRRIASLYALEAQLRGQSPAHRLAMRRAFAKPVIDSLRF